MIPIPEDADAWLQHLAAATWRSAAGYAPAYPDLAVRCVLANLRAAYRSGVRDASTARADEPPRDTPPPPADLPVPF